MSNNIAKETQTKVENQIKGKAEEKTCGICYAGLNDENTVITPCNHAYCTDCFFKWLGRKETCALCRKVLLSDTVVEERLNDLHDVQEELMNSFKYLKVLKKNIKKKRCKRNNLTDDINSLINRQIRMRCLLEQTRSACRTTLAHSRTLKQALELQKEALESMKNYRNEWEELHAPLPILLPTEEKDEEEEEEDEEINIVNMTVALDNMVRLESRRVRAALQRMREAATEETIAAENSDDDDTATEADTEETIVAENNNTEEEGEIESDLTVFGTGIPTFDFITPPRTVRMPIARNHSQSPLFVFGRESNSSTSALESSTSFIPIGPREELSTSPSTIPPILEMQREENSRLLNPGHTARRRLFVSLPQTNNEENTGE